MTAPLPRRVLLVTQYYWPEPGAPSVRYAAITRALRDLGIEVDVLTTVPSYPTGVVPPPYRPWRPLTERHDDVAIRRLPTLPYGGRNKWLRMANHASLAVAGLAGIVLTARPDVVVVESPPLPLVPTAALIARRHRAPLVMYAADLWPDVPIEMGALPRGGRLERVLRGLESLAYRLSWRITVPTTGLVERLERHPDARGKVLLLPNGVDPRVFRPLSRLEVESVAPALGALAGRVLFVYAGTVGPAQALDVVLDAAALLTDDAVGFVVVGDGPERPRLMARAAAMGLGSVIFVGGVQPEIVARYLAHARASLVMLRDLPVFEDARPAKVLPSLACERPVIFCGRGEMAPMIERNECGIVIPPEDPVALAAAVRRLAADEALAREMGARGRAFALAEFDSSRLVRGWIERIGEDMLASWQPTVAT